MSIKLYIIDALGSFVDDNNPPINWSRAPLYDFEDINQHAPRIIKRFKVFIDKITADGYNAISIDDLAHMVNLDIYPPDLKSKIADYQALYTQLFTIAGAHNIKVFVNFDIMYYNQQIIEYIGGKDKRAIDLTRMSLEYLFDNYAVGGVITRIGECDGVDVKSLFTSQLTIKTPAQARQYLRQLLPTFEKYNKLWIFRTWSLGAYKIGDLMWRKRTFMKVFGKITSPNLVISMKYGNGDFFRKLPLNPLFRLAKWQFIIELQTRREYEGFGELPFYTGWDYQRYYNQLRNNPQLIGISVWCMTGGWKKSNRVTYLHNSSRWVELNTASTVQIFRGQTADKCIDNPNLAKFLRLYNRLSLAIMYPESTKEKYFKQIKIPPLTWMFWDNITINNLVMSYYKYVVREKPQVSESDLDKLYKLGKKCQITEIAFIYDTLNILRQCRLFIETGNSADRLRVSIDKYKQSYPGFLNFSFIQSAKPQIRMRLLFYFLLRESKRYRLLDWILFNRFISLPLIRLTILLNKKIFPSFIDSKSMPIETFLK